MRRTLVRRMFNRILHLMARFLPGSTSLRPFLHRLRGVKVYGNIFIGDDVYLENEYPECVEIHDGAGIALRSTIIAHTRGEGKIIIEKNVVIAVGCTIICSPGQSLTIGEGSVISAGSVVQNSIPPHTLCAGPRIKAVATVTVPFTSQTSYQDFVRGLRPLGNRSKKM
jgi:carbonic anhydrase/acetyltransferase-like protein (isoleucine patch superfamily)